MPWKSKPARGSSSVRANWELAGTASFPTTWKRKRVFAFAPFKVLGEAAMSLGDLVRLNACVASAQYLGGYMKVRDEFVGNPPPASTLIVVQGFSRPEFKVEIEAVAARAR
jgi:enamine deaminase RidA (YjgF/YER057c/UK114 family)